MRVSYTQLNGLVRLPNDSRDGEIIAAFFKKNASAHLHPCRECEQWFLCDADPCAGGRVLDAGRVKIGPVIICDVCR